MLVRRGLANKKNIVAALRDFVGEVTEEAKEERVGDELLALVAERNRYRDRLGLALPQVPGRAVHDIAMLAREGLNGVSGDLGNRRMIRERPRYGR